MVLKPADIDDFGVETIARFGDDPSLLGLDDTRGEQYYVPGISVPGISLLEKPFNIPIVGDYESVSLSVDWPRMQSADYLKRIVFTGMLPAEEITVGAPVERDPFDSPKNNARIGAIDDALDEYTGEWGVFLRATVKICEAPLRTTSEVVKTGSAQFICIETEEEFKAVQHLLETRYASAGEIVSSFLFSRAGMVALTS